ncbi:hypothetical protein EV421DRAFT_1083171 [Armillaria borealis]|uniref:Secreted protein n=1 Tax=Armillaria borealis TaxID=47425 RepID=A0AA39MKB0_9AGAR|nr:hypothetical protein EV421DRAFT_1083171 [Armillaria borealis]
MLGLSTAWLAPVLFSAQGTYSGQYSVLGAYPCRCLPLKVLGLAVIRFACELSNIFNSFCLQGTHLVCLLRHAHGL